MTGRRIETRSLTMNVIEAGTGPLVVLCHGFPETALAWRHQVKALSEAGYRVVAPDMRGYGGTDAPEAADQYTVFHAVGDMVALVDALGEDTAVIAGNDWGATIAWQAALMRPDRFRGVAALSVPMMGQPPVPPSRIFPQDAEQIFYTLYFQTPGLAEAELDRDVRQTLAKLYFGASGEAGPRQPGDGTPNPFGMVVRSKGLLGNLPLPPQLPAWMPPSDFDALVSAFAHTGFRGGLNYYRNLDRNWELQQSLAGTKVGVPALFMIGERDSGLSMPGIDAIIGAMPELVADLRHSITVPGAGHWLQQERPDTVSKALIGFLADL